jgi:hypothetical protein
LRPHAGFGLLAGAFPCFVCQTGGLFARALLELLPSLAFRFAMRPLRFGKTGLLLGILARLFGLSRGFGGTTLGFLFGLALSFELRLQAGSLLRLATRQRFGLRPCLLLDLAPGALFRFGGQPGGFLASTLFHAFARPAFRLECRLQSRQLVAARA